MTAGQTEKTPEQPKGAQTGPTGRKRLLATTGIAGGVAIVMASTLATTFAVAQEGPNPALTLTFGSTLNVNDNRRLAAVSPGTTTALDTALGLSYLTRTATSSFGLTASSVLRYKKEPGSGAETGFEDPRFGLSYSRQGANSSLSFAASQRRSEIAFFDPFELIDDPEAPVDSGDLTPGVSGDRSDTSLSLGLETGIEGPLGFSLGLSRRDRDFSETIDPDYFDTRTDTVSLGTRLQVSDRTTANLSYSRTDFRAEDVEQTERLSESLSLGLSHALRPDTVLGVILGVSDIVVDETIGGLRTRRGNDGLTAGLSLNRDMPNGGLGLSYNREVSINGTRDSLTLSRDLELPNGELAFTFGTSKLEGGSSTWIGSLSWRKALPAGALTATLDRRAGTTTDNDEVTTTRARLGWSQELTPATGMNISLEYLDTDSDVPGDDRSRARLQLGYSWDVAQDWQLSGGYTRTRSTRETADATSSNAVFLSLQRSFTFAP